MNGHLENSNLHALQCQVNDSLAFVRGIIEGLSGSVHILSPDGTLLEVNCAALHILERPHRDSVLGSSIFSFVHPDDHERLRSLHRLALQGQSGTMELRLLGDTGEERWLDARAAPFPAAPGLTSAVLLAGCDISQRKREDRRRVLESRILELISSGLTVSELLEKACRAIDLAIPGARTSILLVDEQQGRLLKGAAPFLPQAYSHAIHGLRVGPCEGSCGTAAFRRQMVLVSDIQNDPLWTEYRGLAEQFRLRACWSAPVFHASGTVAATIALYFHEPKIATAEDRALLGRLADLFGIALERTGKAEDAARYQSLLDTASRMSQVGAWKLRLPDLRLTWAGQIRALLEVDPGYTPTLEEAIGFYVPEHRERIRQAIECCIRQGTPYDLQLEIHTARGRRIWVQSTGEAVRNHEGTVLRVQGAIQNISDRKEAESSLRQDRWLLQAAGKIAKVGGWAVGLPGYRVSLADDVYQLLDLPRSTTLSLTRGIELCQAPFRAAVSQALHRCLEEGVPFDLEVEITKPGGQPLWVRIVGEAERHANGTISRARGVVQDITETKAASQALRAGEDRFRLLAQATSDAVWDCDLTDGSLWWSDTFGSIFGYDPAQPPAGASSWAAPLHPDDAARVLNGINAVIAGTESLWSSEFRYRRADGSYATVTARGYVIRDLAGKGIRMVGSMSDVSEQRQMEAQMKQFQRLEAIGQLTGGVAHDFNNLLTVILGSADLMIESASGTPRLTRLAQTIKKAADQGAALTSRLLAFARKQALEPSLTDVNKLIVGMEGLLHRSLGAQVDLQIVGAGGLWTAHVDPAQLENAILNLCLNARDAMRDGGRLTIETANSRLDTEYVRRNPDAVPGQYVLIAISDTGSGMSPEVLQHAFEPFFTTKEVGKGSGLGLSTVYGFAKQSKGHIKVYSEPGEGTTVKLYLPRVHGPAAPVSEFRSHEDVPCGSEIVLVVEDEILVREYVTEQLRSLGYQVLAAANGSEALQLLRQGANIDLLFTDIVMPGGMNGRAVADEARKLCPHLAVLFTSGYTDNAIIHHGRLDPGVQLLHKPYRRRDLALKVRQVLAAFVSSRA